MNLPQSRSHHHIHFFPVPLRHFISFSSSSTTLCDSSMATEPIFTPAIVVYFGWLLSAAIVAIAALDYPV